MFSLLVYKRRQLTKLSNFYPFVLNLSVRDKIITIRTIELIKLCEFNTNNKFKLLYWASRDGFRGSDFHSKCDDRPNTLTLFKASGSSFIFGGYTLASWESCDTGKFKSDPNAFLFSLTNKDNQPCKMNIDHQNKHQHAIYCRSYRGPSFGDSIFGGGRDIHIVDRANTVKESFSNLGYT